MAANPGDTSSGMSSEAPPHPTAPTTSTIGVVDTSAALNYSWQHCIVRISSKAPRHPTAPTAFAIYRCQTSAIAFSNSIRLQVVRDVHQSRPAHCNLSKINGIQLVSMVDAMAVEYVQAL